MEDPTYTYPYFALGTLVSEIAQWEEVLPTLDLLAELVPDNANLLNEVITIFLQNAERARVAGQEKIEQLLVVRAGECSERALKLTENDVGVLYNYACVKGRMGNKTSAFEFLKRVIQLDPRYVNTALNDPDFARFKNDPDFHHLVQSVPEQA